MEHTAEIAVIGAGIIGLAHAYMAAHRGYRVVLFERGRRATGASIRNFGLIWPIGQPHGAMYELAMCSRSHWIDLLRRTRLPFRTTGSLHLAYREDEAAVLREFAELAPGLGYSCFWMDADDVAARSQAVKTAGLIGALCSPTELTVDAPQVVAALPEFLREQYHVDTRFGSFVRSVDPPLLETATERWRVDRVIVCSGDQVELLYPEIFAHSGLTRVKLQMLSTSPQPDNWLLGPALAAGLTLRFYPAFQVCSTLTALRERIAAETPEYDRWGIHGLVSQIATGELILGDSHEYGPDIDVFNKEKIDGLMQRYISGFLRAPVMTIARRWHGVYAKHPEKPWLSIEPAPGVRIVTATGGAGMTLAFGIAEQTMAEMGL